MKPAQVRVLVGYKGDMRHARREMKRYLTRWFRMFVAERTGIDRPLTEDDRRLV